MGYKIISFDLKTPYSDREFEETLVNKKTKLEFIKIKEDGEGGLVALFFEEENIKDDTEYLFTCYREDTKYSIDTVSIEQNKLEYVNSFRIDEYCHSEDPFWVWHHFYMCKAK